METVIRARARVVVVTGLSGAGKSTALSALADIGYYCVDNLPPSLAASTLGTCSDGGIERVALGIDIRVGAFLDAAPVAISELRAVATDVTVLFLDANDDALVRRFSETRRPHPVLAQADADAEPLAVIDGVRLERGRLLAIRAHATRVLDTGSMSVHELRRQIIELFSPRLAEKPQMLLRVVSFGFKHGIPLDADLLFDVRFLDNPHFIPELRDRRGDEASVRDYVLHSRGCAELLEHLERLLAFCLPRYEAEGKSYLTFAIGCTGGHHRSVAVAAELARRLAQVSGRRVGIVHRDIARGAAMQSVAPEPRGRLWSAPPTNTERPSEPPRTEPPSSNEPPRTEPPSSSEPPRTEPPARERG